MFHAPPTSRPCTGTEARAAPPARASETVSTGAGLWEHSTAYALTASPRPAGAGAPPQVSLRFPVQGTTQRLSSRWNFPSLGLPHMHSRPRSTPQTGYGSKAASLQSDAHCSGLFVCLFPLANTGRTRPGLRPSRKQPRYLPGLHCWGPCVTETVTLKPPASREMDPLPVSAHTVLSAPPSSAGKPSFALGACPRKLSK